MIKAPISYTGFKTPETVELSDSDLAVLCAHDPNAKSLIMKARRLALWEQFKALLQLRKSAFAQENTRAEPAGFSFMNTPLWRKGHSH